MKFLKLQLENFRGLKDTTVDFQDGANINIFGANGTGKTTIANAISWLLTDEPVTGERDFNPKTAEAHNLHHKATILVAADDGRQISFSKDFYEKWAKKRGSKNPEFSGHVTDYAINGVPTKKKDYEVAIQQAAGAPLETIKVLTVLGYFTGTLKMEERRKILFEVCGDVSEEEILKRPELDGLKEALWIPGTNGNQSYTPEDLKKILMKEKQGLNKELAAIPERIDELQAHIGPIIHGEKEQLQQRAEELEKEKANIKAAGADTEKQIQISQLQNILTEKKTAYASKTTQDNMEVYKELQNYQNGLHDVQTDLVNLKGDVMRGEIELRNKTEIRAALLEEYKEVNAMVWQGDTVCPTCGQALPPEKVEAAKQAFQQEKEAHKADINRRGQQCSKLVIADLQESIKQKKQKISAMEEKALNYASIISELNAAVIKPPPFETTEEGKALTEEIERLNAELANGNSSGDQKLELINTELQVIADRMAEINMSVKWQGRISELEARQKEVANQLERAEGVINLCEEYTRFKVGMVTDKINSRFKTIGFQLFKDQINGGLKETCEPLIPNSEGVLVEYKSANTAAKINAGLEIIEVLQGHYNTDLPVIIDGAESVCSPRPMNQQTIKLIVSAPDDTLRIKEAR